MTHPPTPATTPLDEKALDAAVRAFQRKPTMENAIRAYLSALPVPPVARSGEGPSRDAVDEDDLCEDCLEQKATEFFETVPNQRCKDCTTKMLEEVCERLRADMPVAPDDPAAVGRVAMLMRDYGADAVDCAKRIVAALSAAPAGETRAEGDAMGRLARAFSSADDFGYMGHQFIANFASSGGAREFYDALRAALPPSHAGEAK